MKRSFIVLSILFLIISLTSCGNLNAGRAVDAKGSITVAISGADRAAGTVSPSDITRYVVTLYNPVTSAVLATKNADVADGGATAVFPDLDSGTYLIGIDAYKNDLRVLTGMSESITVTNTNVSVNISLSHAKVILNSGTTGTTPEYSFITGNTLPATYTLPEQTQEGWVPEGKVLIGWTDGTTTWYVGEEINLDGKTLPLQLTAVWGGPTITCTFDQNWTFNELYDAGLFDEISSEPVTKTLTRNSPYLIPDYCYYKAYEDAEYGVFNSYEAFYIEAVQSGSEGEEDEEMILYVALDAERNEDEKYYFCGWSVGTQIPPLKGGTGEDANYADNLDVIRNVKIVQPGERVSLKDSVTLYAVWAREDLSAKVFDVRYQWGDGRTTIDNDDSYYYYAQARMNAHVYCLIDNLRTDSGTGYEAFTLPLNVPVIQDIFPQWEDLPEDNVTDRWTRSYLSEGTVFNYVNTGSSTRSYTMKYPIQIPILEYHSNGTLYSQNEDEVEYRYSHTFPMPETFGVEVEVNGWNFGSDFEPTAPWWYGNDEYDYRDDIYKLRGWDVEIEVNGTPQRVFYDGDDLPLVPEAYAQRFEEGDDISISFPVKLYADWRLKDDPPSGAEDWTSDYAHIVYTAEDLAEISGWLDEQYQDKLEYEATHSYQYMDMRCDIFIAKSIEIDELPEPLGEHLSARVFGMGNYISVNDGKAPLFVDIISGNPSVACIRALTVKGNFGDYADEWADENCGVFCNVNEGGQLWDCSFEGTAAEPINGIFGRQKQGICRYESYSSSIYPVYYCDNCRVSPGSDVGSIPLYCPIAKTVFLPGTTVTKKVGSLANMTDPHPAFYDIVDDDPTTAVTVDDFYIGETEVTYALWYEVYTWANDLPDSMKYTFNTEGRQGSRGVEARREESTDAGKDGGEPDEGNLEPVSRVSYQDAMIWCNAASEYEGRKPVYYLQGTTDFSDRSKMVKNATASNNIALAIADPDANGYRLPTVVEWEFAARGGNPDAAEWNCAYAGSDSLQGYAVHSSLVKEGSTKYTYVEAVKTLLPNSAGLYDMSGNVTEYSYRLSTNTQDNKYTHGGGESSVTALLKIDRLTGVGLTSSPSSINGFRIALSSFD